MASIKKLGTYGLENICNTCFMNAVIQCMSNCIPISDSILSTKPNNMIPKSIQSYVTIKYLINGKDNLTDKEKEIFNQYLLLSDVAIGDLIKIRDFVKEYIKDKKKLDINKLLSDIRKQFPYIKWHSSDNANIKSINLFMDNPKDNYYTILNNIGSMTLSLQYIFLQQKNTPNPYTTFPLKSDFIKMGHMVKLFSQMDYKNVNLTIGAQQDSHELLNFFINNMLNEMNDNRCLTEKIYKSTNTATWKKNISNCSELQKNITILEENIIHCPACNEKSTTITINTNFMLSLIEYEGKTQKSIATVEDALLNHLQSEYVNYVCSKCPSDKAKKIINILIWPNALIICLKRFPTVNKKITHAVSYSHKLIINETIAYNLVGVLCHSGTTIQSGHYYSYCRNRYDGKWYQYNDNSVNPVDSARNYFVEVYMLFYEKI